MERVILLGGALGGDAGIRRGDPLEVSGSAGGRTHNGIRRREAGIVNGVIRGGRRHKRRIRGLSFLGFRRARGGGRRGGGGGGGGGGGRIGGFGGVVGGGGRSGGVVIVVGGGRVVVAGDVSERGGEGRDGDEFVWVDVLVYGSEMLVLAQFARRKHLHDSVFTFHQVSLAHPYYFHIEYFCNGRLLLSI